MNNNNNNNNNDKDIFSFYRKIINNNIDEKNIEEQNTNKKEEKEEKEEKEKEEEKKEEIEQNKLLQENSSNIDNDNYYKRLEARNMNLAENPSTIKLEKKAKKIFDRMKRFQNCKTEKEKSDFSKEEEEKRRKKHQPNIEVVYKGELDYFINTTEGLIPAYKNIQWDK